jgi:hypothetical protein
MARDAQQASEEVWCSGQVNGIRMRVWSIFCNQAESGLAADIYDIGLSADTHTHWNTHSPGSHLVAFFAFRTGYTVHKLGLV